METTADLVEGHGGLVDSHEGSVASSVRLAWTSGGSVESHAESVALHDRPVEPAERPVETFAGSVASCGGLEEVGVRSRSGREPSARLL